MTIDTNLVNLSTVHSQHCLQKRSATPSTDLWFLQNFIYPELLQKLVGYVTTSTNLNWHPLKGQEKKNRAEVNWEPESVIEEVHMVYDNLTLDLSLLFGRNLKFNGIAVWKDGPGYMFSCHQDADCINVAIQIYLVDGPRELHTKFYFQDQILESTYQKNYGYCMDNINKLPHGIETPVPENHVRYSLYASWDVVK